MYGQLLGTWGRPERMGDNVGRQVVDDCHDMVALVVEKVHSDGKPGTGWPLAHFHLLLFRPPLRYALKKKKNDIIWEFFPTWGGSSQIPKLL